MSPVQAQMEWVLLTIESTALVQSSDNFSPSQLDLLLAEECSKFYADPYGWVMWAFEWDRDDLTGFTGPDQWQKDVLQEIGKEVEKRGFDGVNPVDPIREATASGHGIGKSALTAWLILWIMSTRPNAKGTVTANTSDQLRTKTWGEVGVWRTRCLVGHWFEYNNTRGGMALYHKSYPEAWRTDAQTCREENSEAFAGQHRANSTSFYIFDEASAVPDKIWEVAEGGLTDGEPMFFAFGNPTRNTGAFHDCFDDLKGRWHLRQIDSRTAARTNKKLIDQWIDDWGIDSDFVKVRVLGEFPSAGDMQFMPGDVVRKSMDANIGRYLGDDPLICGIDLARGGDDDCRIGFRRGQDAKSEKSYRIPGEHSRDSMQVVSKLIMLLDRHKPDVSFLDATGLGGPIGDRLRQLGYHVIDVHFGGDADDKKLYRNKTAEMGARFRQWMMDGGAIPDDRELRAQLVGRQYWHNEKDQLVVERKDDFKKRLGASPDWADQLYLTFAQSVPQRATPRGNLDHIPGQRDKPQDYNPLDELDNYSHYD